MPKAFGLISVFALAVVAAAAENVETIDAKAFSGRVVSIDDKVLVLRSGAKDASVPRRQVTDVTFDRSDDLLAKIGQAVLVSHSGDLFAVSALRLDKEHFKFTNPLLGRTQVPMSSVVAVYMPAPTETVGDVQRRCAKLKTSATTQDTLVVAKEGKLMNVRGVLKDIAPVGGSSELKISFRWQDTDRTIAAASVRAIVLAKAPPGKAVVAGTLTACGGTHVAFTSLTLKDQTFTVRTVSAGEKSLARKAVASIRFIAAGATDLSSLTPSNIKEYGFFDRTFGYKTNASVSGGPLRLAGRTYRTGLGLHSFCEITYAIDGKYSQFVTVAGIDDVVRPAGNAELVILGDGKDLCEPIHLTGKDEAKTIRLDIAGVKSLTIRVGFGADGLDVADHVDLAAARLIKADK
ncbi:MAG: NPCBM/NEW2 domain-containing protein [Phycisphaerae bacterium]|nr:NPCBM/NEW2 domain-containing protein [Phycisphaerae bacterium]